MSQSAKVTGDGNAVVQVGGDYHHHEAPAPHHQPVTTSLPPMPRVFHGRDREVQHILDAVDRNEQVVAIHAIDGMAGVGKTTLAVRAAHLLADRFPDGRYFIELHAHTAGQTPADPFDVLGGLLIELGLDPRAIPDTVTGRRDLWRHLLADKKTLVVLDDVATRHQVQPLLPSGRGCLTLITSRHRLLLTDSRPLPLEVLDPESATDLFLTLTHRDPHVPGERNAAAAVAAVCGGLPLAIGLVAGQTAHHPRWTAADIATLASELATATDRLAAVDLPADPIVRAAFDMSYTNLPPARQVLFRRLSLHPGSDLDAHAAAALVGVDLADAATELEALYTDHLIEEIARGRYRLHDLLRDYARTLTTGDPSIDSTHAVDRLLGYYQRAATAADRASNPTTGTTDDSAAPGPLFEDRTQALLWLRTERANLLACLDLTAGHDPARLVALTPVVARIAIREGPWPLALRLHQRAADTAQQLGDRVGEADALSNLGDVHRLTSDYPAATDVFQQALDIYRSIGNRLGEADALSDLGRSRGGTGDYPVAADLFRRALDIYRDIGHRAGEANALNDFGRDSEATGDYPAATDLYQQALGVHRDIGNRLGEANSLNSLGRCSGSTGDYPVAADLFQQALDSYRDIGQRPGEANALHNLGRCSEATGDYPVAADLFQQALDIYRDTGDRMGEANALGDFGRCSEAAGDYPAATALYQRALDIYRDIGNRHGEANALHNLGRYSATNGDYPVAADLFQRALDIYRDISDRTGEANALHNLEVVRTLMPTNE